VPPREERDNQTRLQDVGHVIANGLARWGWTEGILA